MGHSYDFRKGRRPAEGSELKELGERPHGTRSEKALHHLLIKPAENGGLVIEHHHENYDSEAKTVPFEKPKESPELPKGHPLQHIAEALKIPHRITGETETADDEEEKELLPK